MKRIIVIGGNGSGKTTFSLELAKKLKIPLIHLDQYFWKGNWENMSNNEFDSFLIQLELIIVIQFFILIFQQFIAF